ncbi:MAG: hypothetical protein ABI759_13465 [Candidatus Solibacter sp.]
MKRILIVAMVLASCLLPLHSATLERLSLDDLIVRSTTIVRGKVTGSWADFTGSVIYTHYKVQVSEQFKGVARSTVEVMTPGGSVKGVQSTFSGSPLLNNGDEFVFFLWTSKTGITWITGLTQGLFSLASEAGPADRMATRTASRELMLDPATSRPVKDTTLNMKLSDLRSRIAATLAAQGGGK